jgi:hypothetical protein
MNLAIFILGIYFITLCLISKTHNITSTVMIKLIPFFSGLFLMYYGAKMLGWL